MKKLEELKQWLENTLGEYGFTDEYHVETQDTDDDYIEVTVKVMLRVYNHETRDHDVKEICLGFEVYEDNVNIITHDDSYDEIDYLNYNELIWRQMFFEK